MNRPESPVMNFFLILAGISGRDGQVAHLQNELRSIYEPRSKQEEFLLQELALARQELIDLGQRRDQLMKCQQEAAATRFDQISYEQFSKLKKQWRKHPALVHEMMAKTYHGAQSMAESWLTVVNHLSAEAPALGLDEACDALLAEGHTDAIQFQTASGWWLMGRVLAMHPEPQVAIKHWIRRSRSYDSVIDTRRAQAAIDTAPDAGISRAELLNHARQRLAHWLSQAKQLQKKHEADRELFSLGFQADRHIVSSLKSLEIYRKHAQNLVDKLEKRLLSLQRTRQKDESREMQNARVQATKQQRISNLKPKNTTPSQAPLGQTDDDKPQGDHTATTFQASLSTYISAPAAASEALQNQPSQATIPIKRDDQEKAAQTQPTTVRQTFRLHEIEKMFTTWPDLDVINDPNLTRYNATFRRTPKHQQRMIMNLLRLEQARRLKQRELQATG